MHRLPQEIQTIHPVADFFRLLLLPSLTQLNVHLLSWYVIDPMVRAGRDGRWTAFADPMQTGLSVNAPAGPGSVVWGGAPTTIGDNGRRRRSARGASPVGRDGRWRLVATPFSDVAPLRNGVCGFGTARGRTAHTGRREGSPGSCCGSHGAGFPPAGTGFANHADRHNLGAEDSSFTYIT